MSTQPELVVVFGATGLQGGSVAEALAKDVSFKVRAVTRNTDSAKAKALREQGMEVVAADLDKPDTLPAVIEGATSVFLVTNFWQHMDKSREVTQGKAVADACKSAGVAHVVFSSLEDVKSAIGKECPHFDTKEEIVKYMKSIGLPLTEVRMSAYCENLLGAMKPQKIGDGQYVLGIPMEGKPMDFLPISECGECVRSILKQRAQWLGRAVGLSCQRATMPDFAAILSKEMGVTISAAPITVAQYAGLGFPGAEDLAAMFEYYQSGQCDRDAALTRQLHPAMPDFAGWVAANRDKMSAALGL